MYKYYLQAFLVFFVCKDLLAQDCNDLLLTKADQYYTNVNTKPDSLSFLSCSYINKKLKKDEIFIDFLETEVNDVPTFLAVIIAKDAEEAIVQIPMLNATKPDESMSLAFATDNNRGIMQPKSIQSNTQGYYNYNAVLPYLEPHLTNIKTIYYSTSGILNFVNLKFLKTKEGKLLFEKYQVVRLHTAASFLGNKHQLIMPMAMDMLLVGNLRFNCPEINGQADRNIWQYLPGTKKEVESITAILKQRNKLTLLDSCNATETKVVSMINNAHYDIIHFATHGFYIKDTSALFGVTKETYPLKRSGIVLSGANNPSATVEVFNNKGMFTSLDFINMNVKHVKLIVLSTCHSGEGGSSQSGAPLGLILAMLRNGVNAMMISNREVPDAETNTFMTTFYKQVNSNKDVDIAFRNTLKELLASAPKTDWSFFDLVH